jgi:hypothetical protein
MVLVRTSIGGQSRSLTVVQPVDIVTGVAGRATTFDLFTPGDHRDRRWNNGGGRTDQPT